MVTTFKKNWEIFNHGKAFDVEPLGATAALLAGLSARRDGEKKFFLPVNSEAARAL